MASTVFEKSGQYGWLADGSHNLRSDIGDILPVRATNSVIIVVPIIILIMSIIIIMQLVMIYLCS